MNALPDDLDHDKAAELLRLTLPMMSRHDIPATPSNYAVWFSYVSGDNPELTASIDKVIADGQGFTPELCQRLYREHVATQDVQRIERVRNDLGALIREVGSSLCEAGNDADAYQRSLGGFVHDVDQRNDLGGIADLLRELISETRAMQRSSQSLHSLFEAKTREIELLQSQLEAERERAVTDPLTGLLNRHTLLDRIREAIRTMQPGKAPSLIMLDIDHFKQVNDTHGHLIGDRVIRFVARALQNNIKGQDTAARFGGEEFTLLLPATSLHGAQAVAESVRMAVSQAKLVRSDNKKPIGEITVSAGVANYRRGEDEMEFIHRADEALYRAKNNGRNQVRLAE